MLILNLMPAIPLKQVGTGGTKQCKKDISTWGQEHFENSCRSKRCSVDLCNQFSCALRDYYQHFGKCLCFAVRFGRGILLMEGSNLDD